MDIMTQARHDIIFATDLISECRQRSGLSNTTVVILDEVMGKLLNAQRLLNMMMDAPRTIPQSYCIYSANHRNLL